MLSRILTTIAALALCIAVQAQKCTIKGEIDNDSLRKVKTKAYLVRVGEYGSLHMVDSVKVKKGKYKFNLNVDSETPLMLHLVTVAGIPDAELFPEPGNITIKSNAAGSSVTGTVTNDLLAAYKALTDETSPLETEIRRMEFLLGNNASPLAPLMMGRDIAPKLSDTYATQLVKTLDVLLHTHPYYRSLDNYVLSRQLGEGNIVPDIPLPMRDGSTKYLSDYRGKYVLLDFWASWCGPCMNELPNVKKLYDETRSHSDKFVIIGYSLDSTPEPWEKVIAEHGLDREGWLHACDFLVGKSPGARLMKAQMIPYVVLIDPEGRAISFTLRGEELISRVKQILNGDLYYLDQKK